MHYYTNSGVPIASLCRFNLYKYHSPLLLRLLIKKLWTFLDDDFEVASPGKLKTICVVDSGIAFNSPYPTVIRTERGVDLILSFDFTQRDGGDNELPFGVSLNIWVKSLNAFSLPICRLSRLAVALIVEMTSCFTIESMYTTLFSADIFSKYYLQHERGCCIGCTSTDRRRAIERAIQQRR